MSYIIGSFNLLKMDFKSNEETKKNFDKIANIIREEKFDVILILSILVDTFISKISLPMQPVPKIGSISVA